MYLSAWMPQEYIRCRRPPREPAENWQESLTTRKEYGTTQNLVEQRKEGKMRRRKEEEKSGVNEQQKRKGEERDPERKPGDQRS